MPKTANVTPLRTAAKPAPNRRVRPTPDTAVTVRLPQMCEMLSIGATKGQEIIRDGKVESFLIGKTRLITVRSILALAHGEAA